MNGNHLAVVNPINKSMYNQHGEMLPSHSTHKPLALGEFCC